MTLSDLKSSLENNLPNPAFPNALQALWYDAKGDWEKAHHLADVIGGPGCDWVHAYLHRKEGDQWNADYWYRRAGKSRPSCSHDEEWDQIWDLLSHSS